MTPDTTAPVTPPPAMPPVTPPVTPPATPPAHRPIGGRIGSGFQAQHFNPYGYAFQRRYRNYYFQTGSNIVLYPFYDANGNVYWVTYIGGQPYLVTNSNFQQNIITEPTTISSVPPTFSSVPTTTVTTLPVTTTPAKSTASVVPPLTVAQAIDSVNKKYGATQVMMVGLAVLLIIVIMSK